MGQANKGFEKEKKKPILKTATSEAAP